jgi:lysophospholipase L1-like esterase
MIIPAGSKLIMIGDSVTDCNRARPVGEGLFEALGKGYVSLVDAKLQAAQPWQQIRVVNMGTSGNTVRDLKSRWQTDVLDLSPEWVSIMIGINDVWRQFDTPLQSEWAVPLEEYERTLAELVECSQAKSISVILMTPYFIEANKSDPMRVRMDQYSQVVKKLAAKYGIVFVDSQAAFDKVLCHLHPMTLAWDRIHPNTIGHMVIAQAFLDAIEF